MKDYTPSFLGALGTTGTLLLNHVNAVLACLCGILTAITLVIAIIAKRREARRQQVQLVEHELRLCQQCRAGKPPRICPLDPDERPANCPLHAT